MVEKLKIILIFRKEDDYRYVSMSPIVLTRELRKNLEELEMVKVVRVFYCKIIILAFHPPTIQPSINILP